MAIPFCIKITSCIDKEVFLVYEDKCDEDKKIYLQNISKCFSETSKK